MEKSFRDFDLLEAPLEGTSLIEASAGTGKSFSIAGLFLRLIVEKRIPVHEILVVTFTQAATEELRDRIRRNLREALKMFETGAGDDAFLRRFLERRANRTEALGCLKQALRDFDRAAIMTIHGFCRRVLRENAFESLSMFDLELVPSQDVIKEEIIDDYWRKHLYSESSLFVEYALQNGFRPAALLSLLEGRLWQPFLRVIPEPVFVDARQEEQSFVSSFEELRSIWDASKETVAGLLATKGVLKRTSYNEEKIPAWLAGMSAFLSCPRPAFALFPGFEKFMSSGLKHNTRKGCPPPIHPVFDLCETIGRAQEALGNLYATKLTSLKAELFRFAGEELSARKRKKNILYFDDLMLNLLSALQGRGGEALAETIHEKFKAALIDEFQDTDPLQYAIFREVFARKQGTLFLIGDPKQSIYGFRGADLFAYMEAAREIGRRFTLSENWRSEPDLVTALNTLFQDHPLPFVYEGILFHPCRHAESKPSQPLLIDGRAEPPFQLWVMESQPGQEKGIPKAEAREAIVPAVAAEIARLLSLGREGKALVGAKALKEEDIAVLVRRNREAQRMQQALSRLGIPSVLYGTGNLFDSDEAMELERILTSIAAPENASLMKAALVTDILGLGAEELELVISSDGAWEEWSVRFREYQELWVSRGFIRMFRHFLRREKVLVRLMRFPDGERRCTNLLHLSEVLHQISIERKVTRPGLLKWLAMQRQGSAVEPEEHTIRLESDERAVRLVTVHKSKGLEYPVVFCPFGWDGSTLKDSRAPIVFHCGETPTGLTLDLGSEHSRENRRQAEKELLSENLRLLYVSLTRAKARCYFVWGRFREAETSSPAYLLYPPPSIREKGPVDAARENFPGPGDAFMSRLDELAEKAGGAISVKPLPTKSRGDKITASVERPSLSCRVFRGSIDREWGFASFSSLTSFEPLAAERMDRDQEGVPTAQAALAEERQGFFSFPSGTRSGSLLHALFEHLDFSSRDPQSIRRTIWESLLQYGYDPVWEDAVYIMVQRVLQAPLDPEMPDLRLSSLAGEERLHELEFYFPLKRITAGRLREILAGSGQAEDMPLEFVKRMGRLEFSPVRGYMKGFMDLVFHFRGRYYLVDWKSNDLGPRVEDYGPNELAHAMQRGNYILQYLIYTVALHQYLKLRIPGYRYADHFGGIYYIFLRGVDTVRGPDYGIFRARHSAAFIERLSTELIDEGGIE